MRSGIHTQGEAEGGEKSEPEILQVQTTEKEPETLINEVRKECTRNSNSRRFLLE